MRIVRNQNAQQGLAATFVLLFALALPLSQACKKDDNHGHLHDCDPACTGDDLCHHEGICAPACSGGAGQSTCEVLDPDGEVLFCHPEDGLCEPTGEACTATETGKCAAFQICQLYVNAGTCSVPCQTAGGDAFCQKLDATFLCHQGAAGGICAPTCTDAGGTTVCEQLPGVATTCDATSGLCEPLLP